MQWSFPFWFLPERTAPWTFPNSLAEEERIPNLEWCSRNQKEQGVVFPKKAFRQIAESARGGEIVREEGSSAAASAPEMKIWKSKNEFGQNVLCYSSNHWKPE